MSARERDGLVEGARDELAFARAVQSRFPKAPSAWAHRRWVIDAARAAVIGDGSKEDAWALETFREECRACDAAVLKKRLNYAAWSHRAAAASRPVAGRGGRAAGAARGRGPAAPGRGPRGGDRFFF